MRWCSLPALAPLRFAPRPRLGLDGAVHWGTPGELPPALPLRLVRRMPPMGTLARMVWRTRWMPQPSDRAAAVSPLVMAGAPANLLEVGAAVSLRRGGCARDG